MHEEAMSDPRLPLRNTQYNLLTNCMNSKTRILLISALKTLQRTNGGLVCSSVQACSRRLPYVCVYLSQSCGNQVAKGTGWKPDMLRRDEHRVALSDQHVIVGVEVTVSVRLLPRRSNHYMLEIRKGHP